MYRCSRIFLSGCVYEPYLKLNVVYVVCTCLKSDLKMTLALSVTNLHILSCYTNHGQLS